MFSAIEKWTEIDTDCMHANKKKTLSVYVISARCYPYSNTDMSLCIVRVNFWAKEGKQLPSG
jgi:hypothetical protein